DVESARMEVERDLRRLKMEHTVTQEETEKQDVFYAPMVIPQPNEAEVVDTDTDQVADAKDGEDENIIDTELSAIVSGEESQTNEGGNDTGTSGNEYAQEDSPVREFQDSEGERPADDSKSAEEKRSAPENTDAESSKASSAQERRGADPTNQALDVANSARMKDRGDGYISVNAPFSGISAPSADEKRLR
ncbi:MAG: hypothetical protein IIZ34_00555, partial [Eubacterium sp.]|nr:hypothetical protein [Eubacterium sp.]